MGVKREIGPFFRIAVLFIVIYFLPLGVLRFDNAVFEALYLVRWYAREHVLLCLVPAFFIAGAIGVFVSRASVMKYLGAKANKVLAYGVASVSGTVLAVCSCTVLPLFAGIYRMGAGIGPATAFLYSGPAINVLAIILTARILGLEMGIARAAGAVSFSVIIGLLMHFIFRKSETQRNVQAGDFPGDEPVRPLWKTSLLFLFMIGVLVFANWGRPLEEAGFWALVYRIKWILTALSGLGLFVSAALFSDRSEGGAWVSASWDFAKQILPLLLLGVLAAGFLLGRAGHEGIIPSEWIVAAVGGNSLRANLFASVAGAFMYFATLTEVPILQGLMGSGMGKGPALALLLAGPALSLPSMLVLNGIMGFRKTAVYVGLVIVMATVSGMIYGAIS